MKNNIYMQNIGGKFGMQGLKNDQNYPFDVDIEKLLKQKGIEENPAIIFIDKSLRLSAKVDLGFM